MKWFADQAPAIAALAALAACAAAIFAYRAVRIVRSVFYGQMYLKIFDDYAKPEMFVALRTLRSWRANHGPDFAKSWRIALKSGDKQAKDVDSARRFVKLFFIKTVEIYNTELIDKSMLRKIASFDGINILFEIVEPLEFALNPVFDNKEIEILRSVCGTVGTGGLIPPIEESHDSN